MNEADQRHLRSIEKVEDSYFWHQGRFLLVQKILEKILPSLGPTPSAVDLGAGNLGLVRFLKKKGLAVLAVDQHDYTPRAGEAYARANLAQTFTLPFRPQVIFSMDVLEHLASPDSFLEQVYAQLLPQGYLLLTVPAFAHLFSAWDQHLGHHRRYSRSDLEELLKKKGFSIKKSSYFFSFLYPMGWWRKFFPAPGPEFPAIHPLLNFLLIILGKIEITFLSLGLTLPFGTSLMVLAKKEAAK